MKEFKISKYYSHSIKIRYTKNKISAGNILCIVTLIIPIFHHSRSEAKIYFLGGIKCQLS